MDAAEEAQSHIDDLRTRAARAEAARLALNAAARAPKPPAKTRKGKKAREAYWNARDEFYRTIDEAYPPGFWTIMGPRFTRLAAAEPDAVEMAVRFLEADPWFFRSGYVKADLIGRLVRVELSERQKERLQSAALAVVDARDRREFRQYCRLARRVTTGEFQAALAERLQSSDPAIRRRADWMLAFVEDRAHAKRPPEQNDRHSPT